MHANRRALRLLLEAVRADTENTLFQNREVAMDLAETCAALLHLMGLSGHTNERSPAAQDPADMGTETFELQKDMSIRRPSGSWSGQ